MIRIKGIQLLWVYSSQIQPGSGVKKHSHDYYHLISILEGTMNFVLNDKEYLLEKDDTILVHSNSIHHFWNATSEAISFYEIKFAVLSQALDQALARSPERILHDDYVCHLVAHVVNEYFENRASKDESAIAALKTLIYYLTSETRHNLVENPNIIDVTGFTPLSVSVIDFLTEHYSENLTLDDISAGVKTTKNYLCNAFKRDTGMTILDCLNMIRVRKAAELIVYSDLPLTDVAQMSGYASASHFNRVFMRYVGIPPGQCRRAYSCDMLLQGTTAPRSEGSFMYNVLAGKSISSNIIEDFELRKAGKSLSAAPSKE